MSGWSRGDVIGLGSLIVTIVGIAIGVTIPEVPCKVGLQSESCPSPISQPEDQEPTQNGGKPKSPHPNPDKDTNSDTNSDPDLISKSTGVDYNPLRALLAAGKWKEADRETARTMVKAAGKKEEGYFSFSEEIDNLSCEDLRIIDKLWLKYSDDKFGFSVQNKIYAEEGGSYDPGMDAFHQDVGDFNFTARVGWLDEDGFSLIEYEEYLFNLQAPKGHLPSACGIRQEMGYPHNTCGYGANPDYFEYLSYRVKTCDL